MRYFIEFSYNGTNYLGWQAQLDTPKTVQQTLQNAMSTLLRAPLEVVGAGRTDTGVHARKMFAHFEHDALPEIKKLVYRLNSFLPKDIAVHDIFPVAADAHARFGARSRTYEYHIHTKKNVFLENLSWYYFREIDVEKMNQAAQILFEYNDFECFSKSNTDVKTFICKITHANWVKADDRLVFTISADRFLRNMVRAIVGTLIEIGLGKIDADGLRRIIEAKDRSLAGFSAPARGLYLVDVGYNWDEIRQF
ncbi:MAG: tRNA pseudouridine(38-40) synthase TruA [Chitinophagaceae bacterium]|nr:MAG: tRNA pseudouridine(38-40) synthase TruA [Chitinophagaceae bacterium]